MMCDTQCCSSYLVHPSPRKQSSFHREQTGGHPLSRPSGVVNYMVEFPPQRQPEKKSHSRPFFYIYFVCCKQRFLLPRRPYCCVTSCHQPPPPPAPSPASASAGRNIFPDPVRVPRRFWVTPAGSVLDDRLGGGEAQRGGQGDRGRRWARKGGHLPPAQLFPRRRSRRRSEARYSAF